MREPDLPISSNLIYSVSRRRERNASLTRVKFGTKKEKEKEKVKFVRIPLKN